MNKWLKRGAVFTSFLLILAVIGLYLGRNQLLRYIADSKISRAEQLYGLNIRYCSLQMSGFTKIRLTGFTVVPAERDTLLTLDSLHLNLNFFPLLLGRIDIHRVITDGLSIHFVKRDSISNYDFLFRPTDTLKSISGKSLDFSRQVKGVLNMAFGFLPDNGEIRRFSISQQRDSYFATFNIPLLTVKDNAFYTDIIVTENGTLKTWRTRGRFNRTERQIEAGIYAAPGTPYIAIPYIEKYYNASVAFDSLSLSLSEKEIKGKIVLSGSASVNGLNVFHLGLSPDTISMNNGSLNYNINIGKQFIELDSTSTVIFNELNFNPYLKAEKYTKWHIRTSINKQEFPSQQLFNSLPTGLFRHIKGLQTKGSLTYNFLLDVDFNKLSNLKFHSIMRGKSFGITSYGNSELTRMNGEFIYTAYENGQPVRTFAVGPSNPNFRHLADIPPLLQTAILQSEDGGFFYHNGFMPDAIQSALIYDLKVKRFARGGSTISMQLVKNVFLNRHKNIARKLEEALIVWLIEQQHITSKERMYEVYLNIVEWGPLVYGACEASHFYFDKEPSMLTANEAIFMASIIPKPKRFRSFFNSDGTLKESQRGYFRVIANRLKVKDIITEEQLSAITPEIELKGAAKKAVIMPDVMPEDSIITPQSANHSF
ncbi:MAG: biosynthetic peptidoglycan transglycosylase [Bacteroidales bacterium]